MASFNFLERIIWLHARIQSGRYPNADDLAREFDLSSRTAQRTIAHYRDRLGAPIAYHRKRKGYYYSRQDYQFPLGRVSQEELLIILLAQSLSFGADVEVIRPESLRREVAAELQKMKKIYQK